MLRTEDLFRRNGAARHQGRESSGRLSSPLPALRRSPQVRGSRFPLSEPASEWLWEWRAAALGRAKWWLFTFKTTALLCLQHPGWQRACPVQRLDVNSLLTYPKCCILIPGLFSFSDAKNPCVCPAPTAGYMQKGGHVLVSVHCWRVRKIVVFFCSGLLLFSSLWCNNFNVV